MDYCFFVVDLPHTKGELDQGSQKYNQESNCKGSEFSENNSFMRVLEILPDDIIRLRCSNNRNIFAFDFESTLTKSPVAEQKFRLFQQIVVF